LGLRTIVSLRGKIGRSYNLFEHEACNALGLDLHHIHVCSARALPEGAKILERIDALGQLPRPFLLHCKSGADRTGFAAALILILIEGCSVEDAARQLARKHIHFPRSKSGVLGHVFRVYLRDAEPLGIGFRAWLEKGYDPETITADFQDWRASRGKWA
jgi:protein tyrosine/serine phosphatase